MAKKKEIAPPVVPCEKGKHKFKEVKQKKKREFKVLKCSTCGQSAYEARKKTD